MIALEALCSGKIQLNFTFRQQKALFHGEGPLYFDFLVEEEFMLSSLEVATGSEQRAVSIFLVGWQVLPFVW